MENLRRNCWTIFYCQKGSKLGGNLVTSPSLLNLEDKLLGDNVNCQKGLQIRRSWGNLVKSPILWKLEDKLLRDNVFSVKKAPN